MHKSNLILAAALLSFGLTACGDDATSGDVGRDVFSDAASDPGASDSNQVDAGAETSDAAQDPAPDINFDAMTFTPVALSGAITGVQPMTGVVLWADSWNDDAVKTEAGNIQLEYAYLAPNSIMTGEGTYDWSSLDRMLDEVASRGHQAIVRPYYVYPGRETAVPDFIKARSDYQETEGQTEGMTTWFVDWTSAALQEAHLDFFSAFAARYDDDPRLAFLQVGFGLWGEYHIYDGPNTIGEHFPSKAFQTQFFEHLDGEFNSLLWSISIDAGADYYSPLSENASLRALTFGNFDDSFMHENHHEYNESMWEFFEYETRFSRAPHGGELSYYTRFDQEHALDPEGIHGRSFETLSAKFRITYMIGNDQPNYQSVARIRQAGSALGYRFRVVSYETAPGASRVVIENVGTAPIYYDAFPAAGGVRSNTSLRGLLPREAREFYMAARATSDNFEITADRLVPGQRIEFDAAL